MTIGRKWDDWPDGEYDVTVRERIFALTSGVGDQPGKAFIHVVLMMAVEKRVTGVVRHEVDLGL